MKERICELISVEKGDKGANFIPSTKWSHVETSTNSKSFGPLCNLKKPCNNGTCVDTCTKDGFQCTCPDEPCLEQKTCSKLELTNLALRKPTKQSSTFTLFGRGLFSDNAVNGLIGKDEDMAHTSCRGRTPCWWEVDFGSVKEVLKIQIFNRVGCCQDRLVGASITFSNNANH